MKRISIFLALTLVISALVWWPARETGFLYTTLLMFAPAAAAVLTLLIERTSFASLGLGCTHWRWLFAGWAIPVVAVTGLGLITIATGAATFPNMEQLAERADKMGMATAQPALAILVLALLSYTAGIVNMCATAFGEELGWRGFLAPALAERWGWLVSSAIVGVVWALWHYPLFTGKIPPASLMAFTAMIIAFSFVLSWLRAVSGSVWPAVIAHGTHNALFAQFWDRLLVAPEDSIWVGEASVTLTITYALIAFTLWTRVPSGERPAAAVA